MGKGQTHDQPHNRFFAKRAPCGEKKLVFRNSHSQRNIFQKIAFTRVCLQIWQGVMIKGRGGQANLGNVWIFRPL